MKWLINIIAVSLLWNCTTSAQKLKKDSIPAVVQQACKEKFPSAKKIEWKRKSDKNFEAEFMQQGVELAVKFTPEGKWVETESGIKASEVPAAVKNTIAKSFPTYKIIELQKIETLGTTELVYEIHLQKNKEVVKLQYSTAGKELSRSSKMIK